MNNEAKMIVEYKKKTTICTKKKENAVEVATQRQKTHRQVSSLRMDTHRT